MLQIIKKYVYMISLPKCTMKHYVCFFIFISCSIVFQIGFIYFKLRPDQLKPFYVQPSITYKYVLFYNGTTADKRVPTLCPDINCIYTSSAKIFLDDYTKFDAIVFRENILTSTDRPPQRSAKQLYIFYSNKPSINHPALEPYNDDFFNWTLTYRLDSDVPITPFTFFDHSGNAVAPKTDVKWKTSNESVAPHIKKILEGKSRPVVWFVYDCPSNATALSKDRPFIFSQTGLIIDVFEMCGNSSCRGGNCDAMVMKDYYFFMAAEKPTDYVSFKPYVALSNYAVPIVFNLEDYDLYLPPDSYLFLRDAIKTSDYIKAAMTNITTYENYFKWTNLYNISLNEEDQKPLCDLCKALNEERAKNAPAIKNFRRWWNTPQLKLY